MNKSHLAIIALSISAHSISWGMLTVSKIQPRVAKKYFTQEKIERDEQRASEESEVFLNSFGQHSLNKTGIMFYDLSVRAKKKTFPCLSHNQKLLVWCGTHNLEVPFLSAVFNGNEKVAVMYSQKPIGAILEKYAHAKEMKKWLPIKPFNECHYMMLSPGQIRILKDVSKTKFINHANIGNFMKAFHILNKIDSETIMNVNEITDLIKIYPSLSERMHIFYNMIPNDSLKESFLGSLIMAGVGAPIALGLLKTSNNYIPELEVLGFAAALIAPSSMVGYWIGFSSGLYYFRYRPNLKTNILPNQPTLTDYLKKIAS